MGRWGGEDDDVDDVDDGVVGVEEVGGDAERGDADGEADGKSDGEAEGEGEGDEDAEGEDAKDEGLRVKTTRVFTPPARY